MSWKEFRAAPADSVWVRSAGWLVWAASASLVGAAFTGLWDFPVWMVLTVLLAVSMVAWPVLSAFLGRPTAVAALALMWAALAAAAPCSGLRCRVVAAGNLAVQVAVFGLLVLLVAATFRTVSRVRAWLWTFRQARSSSLNHPDS